MRAGLKINPIAALGRSPEIANGSFQPVFPAPCRISFPCVSFRILFPLLVMGWMGIHWLVDFWLFQSDHAVWPAIRLHLMVEFFLLSGFMAALAFLMYYGVTHRVQWLEEEARSPGARRGSPGRP